MEAQSSKSKPSWWERRRLRKERSCKIDVSPQAGTGPSVCPHCAKSLAGVGPVAASAPDKCDGARHRDDEVILADNLRGRRKIPIEILTSSFIQWLIEQDCTGEQARPHVLNLLAEFCDLKSWSYPPENQSLKQIKQICGGKHVRRIELADGTYKRFSTYDIPAVMAVGRAADQPLSRRVA